MAKFADRVKVTVDSSTSGAGAVTLSTAVSGYQAVPSALDGASIRYVIELGTAWEIGLGVYTHSSLNLTRSLTSSSTGSLLSLNNTAVVFISPAAEDLQYVEVYSSTSDLPSASSNHGRIVHVHGDGAMYFAHGGNWVRLGNYSDITSYTLPTASSSTLGGIKIGTGLSIDGSGVVTASGSGGSTTVNYSPAFVGARWKFTSTQSGIGSSGSVLTNYTTRDYDTTANNDFTSTNSRLTVPAGVSRVVVKASAETSNTSSQTALKIYMNGGDIESTNIDIDSTGGDYVFATTPIIEVTQGDYFEAFLFSQNSRSVLDDDRFTWFEIQVIEGSILNSVPQTVQPYDANLKSFTDTFTLPTSDGSANQVLKTDGSGAISFANQSGGIALTDLSVTQNSASGTGALSYNNSSGVFSYTPPASLGAADATNYSVTSYTASAGSNTFNASSSPALPAYQAGKLAVYVNGVLQPASGYTATNGTSVVMTLAANDEVSIVNHGAASSGVTTGKAIAMAIVFGG